MNKKVRRVDIIPHVAHSRISPHSYEVTGFQKATLRTVAYALRASDAFPQLLGGERARSALYIPRFWPFGM